MNNSYTACERRANEMKYRMPELADTGDEEAACRTKWAAGYAARGTNTRTLIHSHTEAGISKRGMRDHIRRDGGEGTAVYVGLKQEKERTSERRRSAEGKHTDRWMDEDGDREEGVEDDFRAHRMCDVWTRIPSLIPILDPLLVTTVNISRTSSSPSSRLSSDPPAVSPVAAAAVVTFFPRLPLVKIRMQSRLVSTRVTRDCHSIRCTDSVCVSPGKRRSDVLCILVSGIRLL